MNNGFIESKISTPITLTSNNSVINFQNDTRSRSTLGCNSWLCHKEGSPIYKIVKCGNYKVDFNAVVYSATAGTVALGLFEDRCTNTKFSHSRNFKCGLLSNGRL